MGIEFIKTDPKTFKKMFVQKEVELQKILDGIKKDYMKWKQASRYDYPYDKEFSQILYEGMIKEAQKDVEKFQKLQKVCNDLIFQPKINNINSFLVVAKEKKTEDVVNYFNIERRNKNIICPFHNDSKPSMYMYDKDFHCFACGWHGDCIEFVKQYSNITFIEAVKITANI